MTETNHRITLAKRPVGPVTADCFATDDVEIPAPGPGEALAKVEWLSIDPTIRGWMAMDTYLPAIEIGAEVRSGGLATVIESNNDDLPVGSTVFGMTGWQEYCIIDESNQVVPEGIDPTAAARAAGGNPTDGVSWRVVVRAVRQAAAELVDDGKLQVLRKGKPADIRTVKGVIRLALPDGEP